MKTGLDYRNKITFARVFFSQIAKKIRTSKTSRALDNSYETF